MLPTPKVLGAVSTPKVFGAGGSLVKTVSAKIGTVKNYLVPFLEKKNVLTKWEDLKSFHRRGYRGKDIPPNDVNFDRHNKFLKDIRSSDVKFSAVYAIECEDVIVRIPLFQELSTHLFYETFQVRSPTVK